MLPALVVSVVGLASAIVGYFGVDKNERQLLVRLTFWGGAIAICAGGALQFQSGRASDLRSTANEQASRNAQAELTTVRENGEREAAASLGRANQQAAEHAKLIAMLEPFQELARKRFPDRGPEDGLKSLRSQLEQVASRTTNLEVRTAARTITPAIRSRSLAVLGPAPPIGSCTIVFDHLGDSEAFSPFGVAGLRLAFPVALPGDYVFKDFGSSLGVCSSMCIGPEISAELGFGGGGGQFGLFTGGVAFDVNYNPIAN